MGNSLHEGHRARLRARFEETGLAGFQPHEILEMLLFYAIPRRDTNELAHRLMDTFGSLHHVLEAPQPELVRVEGMTENAATLLRFSSALLSEYYEDKYAVGTILNTTEDLTRLLLPRYMGIQNETVYLVCMDAKRMLLNCSPVCYGSVGMANISPRLILQRALLFNATIVVLAHNHPSGLAVPSQADLATTVELVKLLSAAEITLWDHLVFGGDDCVSMRDTPTIKNVLRPR
ncbi:MAG: RadC family protein [Clostridia bacterium]|nr:RadC family protein [Clostridia bacterium]